MKNTWKNLLNVLWDYRNIKDIGIANTMIEEIKKGKKMSNDIDENIDSSIDKLIDTVEKDYKVDYDKYIDKTIGLLGPCFNTKNYKVSFDHQKSAINSLLNEFNKLSIDFDLANNYLSV